MHHRKSYEGHTDEIKRVRRAVDSWYAAFGPGLTQAATEAADDLEHSIDSCLRIIESDDGRSDAAIVALQLLHTIGRCTLDRSRALIEHTNPADADLNLVLRTILDLIRLGATEWLDGEVERRLIFCRDRIRRRVEQANPPVLDTSAGDWIFVRSFRHWRSGKTLHAEDYGLKAFRIQRRSKTEASQVMSYEGAVDSYRGIVEREIAAAS